MTKTAFLFARSETAFGEGDPASQLNRVAREVLSLAQRCQAHLAVHDPQSNSVIPPSRSTLAELARRLYKERQDRSRYIPEKLCREPGWNIMLDLFAATIDGQDVAISAACYGSGVAPTTALRWVEELRLMELVDRIPDPADHRRTYLRLTAKGYRMMEQYLAGLVTSGSRHAGAPTSSA